MFETNELKELLQEIGEINEAIFPGHIVIGALVIMLTLWCYLRPSSTSSKMMEGFLAAYYGIIVYTCIICALNLQEIYYYLTVVVHMGICLLFILKFLVKQVS